MANNELLCPRCNKEIFYKEPFCRKCGQPLVWEDTNTKKPDSTKEPRFFNKWVWVASIGLVSINMSQRLIFDKYFHPLDFILTNFVNFFFYAFIFATLSWIIRKLKKYIKK